MSPTKEVKHVPGDVNHQFLAAAGYDFCTTCGSSLRGKRTALETEMLEALELIARHGDEHSVAVAKDAIRKARGGQ